VLDERASVVVDAEDLLVDELFGEVLSEEGGEGGGGDVGGGEAEDVSDLFARIELGVLSKLKRRVALFLGSLKGKWVPMDHSKSKKHEGVAVCLANASNLSKKIRIAVFEHFTHQLVIVLIDPLVTVCTRCADPPKHLMPPISHWCVQAVHLLSTQRTNFLGSEGEQADDLSTGSTPTGNVEGSFAFLVSCGEGLFIQPNRLHAHMGKSMCVCLSFRCHPMMWQSSMLIFLLELSPEQI